MTIQLAIQGTLFVLVSSLVLFDFGDRTFDAVRLVLAIVWLIALVFYALQFRTLGSWRSLPVGSDEEMLWGTLAVLARPSSGFGYGGQFSLSTRRLRFRPGPIARLRGATPAEWPTESFTAVRVTSGSSRVYAPGRWVVLERESEADVVLLSSEPRVVADDLDRSFAKRLRP